MGTNVDIVKGIYAAFGKQDIPAILERIADDVDWEYGGRDRGVPWLLPRRGRAGAGEFFQSLAGLEFRNFQVNAVLGEGAVVVALVDVEFIVRATGKRVTERDEVHVWRFDDKGRVVAFKHGVDTSQHEAAVKP